MGYDIYGGNTSQSALYQLCAACHAVTVTNAAIFSLPLPGFGGLQRVFFIGWPLMMQLFGVMLTIDGLKFCQFSKNQPNFNPSMTFPLREESVYQTTPPEWDCCKICAWSAHAANELYRWSVEESSCQHTIVQPEDFPIHLEYADGAIHLAFIIGPVADHQKWIKYGQLYFALAPFP